MQKVPFSRFKRIARKANAPKDGGSDFTEPLRKRYAKKNLETF